MRPFCALVPGTLMRLTSPTTWRSDFYLAEPGHLSSICELRFRSSCSPYSLKLDLASWFALLSSTFSSFCWCLAAIRLVRLLRFVAFDPRNICPIGSQADSSGPWDRATSIPLSSCCHTSRRLFGCLFGCPSELVTVEFGVYLSSSPFTL
jgi:hypothetical protein